MLDAATLFLNLKELLALPPHKVQVVLHVGVKLAVVVVQVRKASGMGPATHVELTLLVTMARTSPAELATDCRVGPHADVLVNKFFCGKVINEVLSIDRFFVLTS